MENPLKVDDLGIPLFLETPIYNTWWVKPINHYYSHPRMANFNPIAKSITIIIESYI